jgi:hypothetical protein
MRSVVRTLVVAVALVTGAPTLHAQALPRATSPLADTLRAFARNMGEIFRRMDIKATVALYGGYAHFVHVEDGNIETWPQLEKQMTEYFATAKSNPVSVVGEPGVIIMDANNAVLYVTHRMEASENRPAHIGVWSGVLHRYADGWKVVHSHSSDRPPQR